MANNRITYATAQLSIKDNKADATTDILGWRYDGVLGSGHSAADGLINLTPAFDGAAGTSRGWPANGMFRIQTASVTEYIRYGERVGTSGFGTLARGAGGSTAASHNADDVVQLVGWECPLGVQSVSIGTNFNTEDTFQLGQLDAYENVEGIPDIECSIERVLDGTKPLWLTVTDGDYSTLKGRTADYKCDVALSVYPDTQDNAEGTPDNTCTCSGMYVSAWSCSLPAEGNFTESVTLVGNDKTWTEEEGIPSGFFMTADAYDAAVIGSGVSRTEDYDAANSTRPGEISSDEHIQSIEVSVDITREEIFQLGQKTPFYRAVSFPITVTTSYEVITSIGDNISAIGNGKANLTDRSIIIKTKGGLKVNLGTKNKLASVSFEGFDAGGGNASCTYEYTNSNALTITHDKFHTGRLTNTDLL